MNNPEKHGYIPMPIWEGHAHALCKVPIERTVELYERAMAYYNYERMTVCAIINESDAEHPADNAVVFYAKAVMNAKKPNTIYAFGNFEHYYDERDTAEGYLAQVKELLSMGADGIKILDGKTSDRKRLNRRLDDPIFDKMYAYLEENNIPIVSHVGDPRKNWDKSQASEYEIKKGWVYDETYPTLDELYAEVDGILTKFPKLNLTLAHFYFISDNYDGAVAMMEKWENVKFDLTPGGIMFKHFTEDIEKWRAFFVKYADRITYGTDAYNFYPGTDDLDALDKCMPCGHRINELRTMLEKTEPFDDITFGMLTPLHLDTESLEKIYYRNVEKLLGDAKPMNFAACAAYCRRMENEMKTGVITTGKPEHDALDLSNIIGAAEYFENK